MAGSVIQGCFPRGVIQPHAGRGPAPDWVQQRIAGGGGTARVTQPKAAAAPPRPSPNGSAVPLPAQFHIATAGGQPLPPAVRQKMEAAFGQRFDDVRVHVGPQAAAIGATAFTHGAHIHFAPGRYEPHTPRGEQILAHELAHVVQQRTGRARSPFPSGVAVLRDTLLEAEADRMAERACRAPAAVQRCVRAPGNVIQRAESSKKKFKDPIDLVNCPRSELSWQNKPEPTGYCENEECGEETDSLEYDHMNPWRPYIASILGEHEYELDGNHMWCERERANQIYNDPENLWYLCTTCNKHKSDKVYDSASSLKDAKNQFEPKRKHIRRKEILNAV